MLDFILSVSSLVSSAETEAWLAFCVEELAVHEDLGCDGFVG